ncbi:MAG: response regulator [Lautropia sp.]|nr:response regulator [Lautropia sp.]
MPKQNLWVSPNRPLNVLVVEDEPKLAVLVCRYLDAAGFRTGIMADGRMVVESVRANPPDLVLLDLMLPGRDGIDICREIRSFSALPIIMMTARVEEIDRLLGLELGADDYICKPFSPREMVARVRAVLRRTLSEQAPSPVVSQQPLMGGPSVPATPPEPGVEIPPPPEGLWIDTVRHLAWLEGNMLELTPVEFRLLSVLAAMPGEVFSREDLLIRLYEDHRVVNDRTVDTHVKNLRRKMAKVLPGSELIQSVYGMGYKYQP